MTLDRLFSRKAALTCYGFSLAGRQPRCHGRIPHRGVGVVLTFAVTAVFALVAPARAHANILFYGGDFEPGSPGNGVLANEHNTSVSLANVYQNFIVPAGQIWNVTSLFSNDLLTAGTTIASADWSISTGVSSGNPGTLFAGGNSPVTITPTGRTAFGDVEYTFEVMGLSVLLSPGTYWLDVTPVGTGSGRSFNSNTLGLNAVGSDTAFDQFFNSPPFSDFYTPTLPPFANFSDGVGGSIVPEPTSLTLVLSCVTLFFGSRYYRQRRRPQSPQA
jgi:hypothetical protein